MRDFGRRVFGLNATTDRLRSSLRTYGLLTLLWLILTIYHLTQPSPFGSSSRILTIVQLVFVVVLISGVIARFFELRKRN